MSPQVVDQYLSFIAPSGSLYSLLPPPPTPTSPMSSQPVPSQQQPSSYLILNSPSSSEDQIENEIERIACGLFSVVATLGACPSVPPRCPVPKCRAGQVPIIRAPRGNAAEMIAKKVETKIRDSLITSSRSQSLSLFSQESGGLSTLQRPRQCASQHSTHVHCRLTDRQFSSSSTVTSTSCPFSHTAGHTRPSSLIASK